MKFMKKIDIKRPPTIREEVFKYLRGKILTGEATPGTKLIESRLADEMVMFTASKIIGGRDAIELCASGVPLSRPIRLIRPEIVELDSGYMIRGCINSPPKGG